MVLQNSKEHHVEFIYDYNQSTNYFDNTTIMVSSTTYFTPHEYLSISCSCSSIFFTRENHLERTFFSNPSLQFEYKPTHLCECGIVKGQVPGDVLAVKPILDSGGVPHHAVWGPVRVIDHVLGEELAHDVHLRI